MSDILSDEHKELFQALRKNLEELKISLQLREAIIKLIKFIVLRDNLVERDDGPALNDQANQVNNNFVLSHEQRKLIRALRKILKQLKVPRNIRRLIIKFIIHSLNDNENENKVLDQQAIQPLDNIEQRRLDWNKIGFIPVYADKRLLFPIKE